MKKILLSIILCNMHAFACEHLDGHWKSDNAMSLAYNSTLESLPKNKKEFIEQVFGYAEIIHKGNAYHFLPLPTIEITIEGKNYPFFFEEVKVEGVIHECSSEKVIAEYPNGIGTAVMNFEGPDVYWVSPDGDWREYFVRIK
ncbi:hypothetical protein [Zooshikella ganghwensis]|uniref:hypothetical protein n=1 Tax=Zooshikella ganghwensis TaxID=202772 RepID=UPI000480AAEF|nr:hypothetical protein [Zooshikella ganghwensis]